MKRKKVFVLFYDDMYDLFDTKIPSDFGFEKIFELPQGALLSMTHDHHQLFGPNYFARINLQSRHSLLTTHTLTTILHEHNIEVLHQSMLSIFSGKRKKPPLPPEEVLAVGFSSTMPKSIAWLNRCISNTKKLFPDAPVIVGGPSIILNPGWHEKVGADFFVVGDAEETLPRLLDSLARQLDIQSLPNLYWRDRHGEITCNPLHFKNCLQAAPITRWDLFDARSWPPAIHFESIRGCVYNCKFCSVSQLSKRIQLKSAERIAEEFAFYAARQVEFVLVFDSSMFTPLKRMKTFLTLMEKRHLPLRWGAWAHITQVQSPELCKRLFQAGCRIIYLGIESGDQTMIDHMGKGFKLEQAHRAIQNIKDANLLCAAHFMVGFPGETPTTAKKTLEFIKQTTLDGYTLFQFFPVNTQSAIMKSSNTFHFELEFSPDEDIVGYRHDTMDHLQAKRIADESRRALAFDVKSPVGNDVWYAGDFFYNQRLDDRTALNYRQEKINPILKAYERCLYSHPDIHALPLLDGPSLLDDSAPLPSKSLEAFKAHQKFGLKLLQKELQSGRLKIATTR